MINWVLAIFWTIGVSLSPYLGKSKITAPLWYKLVITLLALVGGVGFWGNVLSTSGELNWLPPSFAWPVGYAKGVVTTEENFHIVPVTAADRVQIYTADWTFVSGWHIGAHGGDFWVQYHNGDTFEIFTARGQKRYQYDLQGQLLAEGTYDVGSSSLNKGSGQTVYVSSNPVMLIWSSSFFSVLLGLVAMLMIKAAYTPEKKTVSGQPLDEFV